MDYIGNKNKDWVELKYRMGIYSSMKLGKRWWISCSTYKKMGGKIENPEIKMVDTLELRIKIQTGL